MYIFKGLILKETMINLKQRIDENIDELQKKCLLTKPLLKMINSLLEDNTSDREIYQWLEEHDNIIFAIEYNLKLIEQKNNYVKQK